MELADQGQCEFVCQNLGDDVLDALIRLGIEFLSKMI